MYDAEFHTQEAEPVASPASEQQGDSGPAGEGAEVVGAEAAADVSPRPVELETRVLLFRVYAPLHVVAAANCLRCGRGFQTAQPSDADDKGELLAVSLSLQRADGESLLTFEDMLLQKMREDEREAAWVGHLPAYGLQVAWVWDFYRLLSFVYLQVQVEPSPTAEQAALWDALQALVEGDVMRIRAALPTGDLDQVHAVTGEFLTERDRVG